MSNEGIVMSDRDDFEAWHKTKYRGLNYKIIPSGQYLHERVNLDYQIWQAALEHCKQGEPVGHYSLNGTISGMTGELPINTPLFAHAMPKSDGKATLDKMREALEALNGMFWVDKSTKHEIYESAHYPGQNQFTRESLGKHVFQLLRELDGETFENNILSTPQPTTDISESTLAAEVDRFLEMINGSTSISDINKQESVLRALIAKHTVK